LRFAGRAVAFVRDSQEALYDLVEAVAEAVREGLGTDRTPRSADHANR